MRRDERAFGKRDERLRNSMLADLEQCRALIRLGYAPAYWTDRYIELAALHNRLFPAQKQQVRLVP